jgi:MFS family permease
MPAASPPPATHPAPRSGPRRCERAPNTCRARHFNLSGSAAGDFSHFWRNPAVCTQSRGAFGRKFREGLQWTYRHRTLGTLAASTHAWFLANGAAMTVLSLLALRTLRFTALAFGLLLTVFGIASLVGASIATRAAARLGSRWVIILARMAYPVAWLLVAIAPATAVGDGFLFVALFLQGLAAGTENSNEMGYRQALTPDELLGRVNATRRSVNRTMGAVGALVAGVAVGLIGDRVTLIERIVALAAEALIARRSPLRDALDN